MFSPVAKQEGVRVTNSGAAGELEAEVLPLPEAKVFQHFERLRLYNTLVERDRQDKSYYGMGDDSWFDTSRKNRVATGLALELDEGQTGVEYSAQVLKRQLDHVFGYVGVGNEPINQVGITPQGRGILLELNKYRHHDENEHQKYFEHQRYFKSRYKIEDFGRMLAPFIKAVSAGKEATQRVRNEGEGDAEVKLKEDAAEDSQPESKVANKGAAEESEAQVLPFLPEAEFRKHLDRLTYYNFLVGLDRQGTFNGKDDVYDFSSGKSGTGSGERHSRKECVTNGLALEQEGESGVGYSAKLLVRQLAHMLGYGVAPNIDATELPGTTMSMMMNILGDDLHPVSITTEDFTIGWNRYLERQSGIRKEWERKRGMRLTSELKKYWHHDENVNEDQKYVEDQKYFETKYIDDGGWKLLFLRF